VTAAADEQKFQTLLTANPKAANRYKKLSAAQKASARAAFSQNRAASTALNGKHATKNNPNPFSALAATNLFPKKVGLVARPRAVTGATRLVKRATNKAGRLRAGARSRATQGGAGAAKRQRKPARVRFAQRPFGRFARETINRYRMESEADPLSGAGKNAGRTAGKGGASGTTAGRTGGKGGDSGDAAGRSGGKGGGGGETAGPTGVVSGTRRDTGAGTGNGQVTLNVAPNAVSGFMSVYNFVQRPRPTKGTAVARDRGAMAFLRNQGDGSTCWANAAVMYWELYVQLNFPTYESVTTHTFKGPYSVDQVIKCVPNSGAKGGSPIDALKWISMHQLQSDESVRGGQPINCNTPEPIYTALFGFFGDTCTKGNCAKMSVFEPQMRDMMMESFVGGTLRLSTAAFIVYVDATNWRSYKHEYALGRTDSMNHPDPDDIAPYAFPTSACSFDPDKGNHIATIVAMVTDKKGKSWWKLLNSWGTEWGVNGYIYLQYGVNACGIMNYPFGLDPGAEQ